MKSILLASASIVAFSGAAAAEVVFTGEALVGFNSEDSPADGGDEDGFYWELDLDVALSQELDNGVTATAIFGIDLDTDTDDLDINDADYLFSLTSDMGGMYFGETTFAAETYWQSVGDMEADSFSEADGEPVLRGEVMFGNVTAGVSYVIGDVDNHLVQDNSNDNVDQLSLGLNGEFGMFTFAGAYQEESIAAGGPVGAYDPAGANGDFNTDQVWGVSVGTSFAGADLSVGYAEEENSGESSTGIQVSYPFGPITATAYYVMEECDAGGTCTGNPDNDDEDNYGVTIAYASGPIAATLDYDNDQDVHKLNGDMTYDVGNGLTVIAGFENKSDDPGAEDGTDYYVGGTFDLGSGAEVLFAYAEDDNDDDGDQEIGSPELEDGITVEATFTF